MVFVNLFKYESRCYYGLILKSVSSPHITFPNFISAFIGCRRCFRKKSDISVRWMFSYRTIKELRGSFHLPTVRFAPSV